MATQPIETLEMVLAESTATYWTQPALWVVPQDLTYPEHPLAMAACQVTSNILYLLSGRKYPGLVEVTEQYFPIASGDNTTSYMINKIQPERRNFYNIDHRTDTSRYQQRFPLRHYPVRQIIAVDNTANVNDYYLTDYRYLTTAPGSLCRMSFGLTVTYVYGTPPPISGRFAARAFAEEILKSVTDPEACQLPQRVTSVTRQGMSFTMLDPQDFLEQGRTGVYAVDLFLSAVNPNKAQKRSKTFNVDITTKVEKRIPSTTNAFNETILLQVQEVRNRTATGQATVFSASQKPGDVASESSGMQAPSPFYVPAV